MNATESVYFPLASFKKFEDPTDPLYPLYHDRKDEMFHDKGWNNALDHLIIEIFGGPVEPWEIRLKK